MILFAASVWMLCIRMFNANAVRMHFVKVASQIGCRRIIANRNALNVAKYLSLISLGGSTSSWKSKNLNACTKRTAARWSSTLRNIIHIEQHADIKNIKYLRLNVIYAAKKYEKTSFPSTRTINASQIINSAATANKLCPKGRRRSTSKTKWSALRRKRKDSRYNWLTKRAKTRISWRSLFSATLELAKHHLSDHISVTST